MKTDQYDHLTYGGLVNRIRDGVSLTDHQKKVMAKCGLTIDDFRNQKSDAEKAAIVNAYRMMERLRDSLQP